MLELEFKTQPHAFDHFTILPPTGNGLIIEFMDNYQRKQGGPLLPFASCGTCRWHFPLQGRTAVRHLQAHVN